MTYGAIQAQTGGAVKDLNGDLIPGVSVIVECDGSSYATASDGEGRFSVPFKAGCSLSANRDGFERWYRVVGEETWILIVLKIEPTKLSVSAEMGRAESKEAIPQAVTIISTERLRERPATVLAQIAEEQVGVSLQRTSPTIGAIFVRGLTGKNVSLYLDGVRYTNSAQRGGISTFFNLNDSSSLQAVELLRGASSAQYGSDSLGGSINLVTVNPTGKGLRGEFNLSGAAADLSYNSSSNISFGNERTGAAINMFLKRANTFRPARGLDSHAAVTRFLGLSSAIYRGRMPDTAFTQYGGSFRIDHTISSDKNLFFRYQRSHQDGGKRWDQLGGGDGNLVADLRNLMGDFGYLRLVKNKLSVFDSASFTFSYNSQREERVNQGGQGNPLGTVTHQYERTSVWGGSGFLEKNFSNRNDLLIGGDYYYERIKSPAYTFNPLDGSFTLSRPRIPHRARFRTLGLYVQDSFRFADDRIRISGALRYNHGSYQSFGNNSPIVSGRLLWEDDALSVDDFSGRIGVVGRLMRGLNVAFNYSRGFRYPGMTDLGTIGLTGDGFEADFSAASALGGTIGNSASAEAISTGRAVTKQESEFSNTFDASFRYSRKGLDTDLTVFVTDIKNTITKQALILPNGAVGRYLGDQQIVSQRPNGTVFVSLSTVPVLVRANYSDARMYGFEFEFESRVTAKTELRGNYTAIKSEDVADGLPPNIEGGTPPSQGVFNIRYQALSRVWLETGLSFAGRQDRLSSLDLSDRRTGATRSRTQIQNYFRRGACMLGLTNNPDGYCGTGDETVLLSTNETIFQVQNRVLGVGNDNVPLFRYLPGFALVNIRGGIKFERGTVYWAVENIFDQFNRKPSWGMDGSGRNLRLQYSVRF